MPAPTPPLIPQPFAESGDRNTIPDTSADPQRARYQLGFPPATMTPIDAGGQPMLGPDMNGILWDVTSWLYALQGGQLKPFDAAVSTVIGGYKKGAVVAMSNGEGYWISIVDGNITDPESGTDTGWRPLYEYGGLQLNVTGGTLTLDALQAARPMIILTGTLLGNQQIVLPNVYQQWLIVNRCTGPYTVSIRTDAGTPLEIPAGGPASPTAIYCDAESRISRVFTPSALPTSVSPIADSIVLRDNTGRQFALTAASNTRTTQVATTAFANPAGNLAVGWRQNADGSIEQWGVGAGAGANRTINFPVAFPTEVQNIQLTPRRASGDALGQTPVIIGTPGLSSFVYAPPDGSSAVEWRAIGR